MLEELYFTEEQKALPVWELNFGTISNIFRNEGIETLGGVIAISEEDFLRIENAGRKKLQIVKDILTKLAFQNHQNVKNSAWLLNEAPAFEKAMMATIKSAGVEVTDDMTKNIRSLIGLIAAAKAKAFTP